MSCGADMDRICKWSVRYGGESCALEFIGRIEELCEVYELPLHIMPRIIMELFSGKAAVWYRNNRKSWAEWQEFKQVRQTLQLDGEKFKDYALRLQDMQHLNYTTHQKLERICRNSRREYQLFFGDTAGKELTELIALRERFEDMPAPKVAPLPKEALGPSHTPRVNAPTTTNSGRNAYLHCGQPGHFARDCNSQSAPFCWDCGRPGVPCPR
uniref:CCHC-type domain-containing protein n=1 Tax=Glossina pallidipes TaxID=7398 RepID=A0A1A9ZBE6_GLOPL